MDYIEQTEKLFKFLDFNLEFEAVREIYNLKHKFNNDLNLFGCFIKDYLIIVNNKVSDDDNIYSDFVLYFESARKHYNDKDIINLLLRYSKYYLWLVFEEPEIEELEKPINTINSCFALDLYPCLMKLIDNFINQKIDGKYFSKMLQFIVDIVLKRFENPKIEINFDDILNQKINFERLVG